MTEENRFKISNNNFADFFVQGYETINLMINSPDYTINKISDKYGVFHIPVENMTYDSIQRYGYGFIPKCYGLLSPDCLAASGVTQLRQVPDFDLKGQGVLIGFVDTGIDYMNPVFQNFDNTTRIISIWDQTIDSDNYPKDFFYGTEYNKNQINGAITALNPYSIVPSIDEVGHGTVLAGVAAGSEDRKNGFEGVATDCELVVVKLKAAKSYLKEFFQIPENALCFQENDIMLGIQYLLNIAAGLKRPIAICIGVGSSQGSHEGLDIFSRYLNDLGMNVGNSVVVAAGNEGNERHHYYGEINPISEFDIISLNIGEEEKGFSMELWGYAPNIVEVDVYSPRGELVTKVPLGFLQQDTVVVSYGETTIYIDNQFSEELTGNQLILFRFFNPLGGGWRFVLSGQGDLNTRYHIWLPISNFLSNNTYFLNAVPNTTLSIPSNASNAISVTTYNHQNQRLYYNASRGFTKNNGLKPDVAAPGINIKAPTIDRSYKRYTGSSIAAAYTVGIAAMILEWGILKGNFTTINNVSLRRMLISGARRSPFVIYPNTEWGFGVLDIYRTFSIFYLEY